MHRFNGERLKMARIYRGLTVQELAQQSNCQRQTLSMYELSRSQPGSDAIIERISKVLHFPIDFFYERNQPDVGGSVYFRSLLTTSKKYRTEQVVKMELLSCIYNLLQDYVEFPPYQSLELPDDASPETAAAALREAWGLGYGPIDNLISIVERHGILVTSFSTSTDDVDAFSKLVGTEDYLTYLIAYSNNKTAAARIHFDIAHELGHICLHDWSEDIESISKEEFRKRERAANDFAAAFLLPESVFRKDALMGPQTLPYYKRLKKKWKVSIAAMIRRAKDIGVMSQEEYLILVKQMQRRGQRKMEPLDDILLTAGPGLLKMAVMLLLQEKVFSPKEFMDELSVSYNLSIYPQEVEHLLDLPTGTLANNNIIDFTSLQLK